MALQFDRWKLSKNLLPGEPYLSPDNTLRVGLEDGFIELATKQDLEDIELTPGPTGPKGDKGDKGDDGSIPDISGLATKDELEGAILDLREEIMGTLVWMSATATNAIASIASPAPGAGQRIILEHVIASYGAKPTGGSEDWGNGALPITEAGLAPVPQLRLPHAVNAAASVSLAAGGSGVPGALHVGYRTEAV
jgi:hypothetical protein